MKVDKKKIIEHINRCDEDTCEICPFDEYFPPSNYRGTDDNLCFNSFCGKIFPKWRSAILNRSKHGFHCPCDILSNRYVKRKFRKWLKEKKEVINDDQKSQRD